MHSSNPESRNRLDNCRRKSTFGAGVTKFTKCELCDTPAKPQIFDARIAKWRANIEWFADPRRRDSCGERSWIQRFRNKLRQLRGDLGLLMRDPSRIAGKKLVRLRFLNPVVAKLSDFVSSRGSTPALFLRFCLHLELKVHF